MSTIEDVYGSNTLKAEDIQGREPTVIIKSVEPREFKSQDGRVQKKLIISFEGAKKTLVCNKTNAQRIAYLHGKDYNAWPGKKITLFVDPFVQFGNEITAAIRVKPPEFKQNERVTTQQVARPASSEISPPSDQFGAGNYDDEIPF